jgi:hypothetical protein
MKPSLWLTKPIFMVRYWASSWLISLGLLTCPHGPYADELRRRIYALRDEVSAKEAR